MLAFKISLKQNQAGLLIFFIKPIHVFTSNITWVSGFYPVPIYIWAAGCPEGWEQHHQEAKWYG